MLKKEKRIVWIILGALIFLNLVAWATVYELSRPRFLEIIFFDVGQGDAIWIEMSDKKQILIDGGPDSTILEKLAQEMPFYDKTIDLVVLTHPEADHLSGLIEVLKSYKIKNILWTGVEKETELFEEWQEVIDKEGAKIIIALAGQKIRNVRDVVPDMSGTTSLTVGRAGAGEIYFEILNPLENLEGQKPNNTNNTSVVLKLIFGKNEFLFTGDIYQDKENELMEKYNLESDVLKISHHGSKTSTSQDFLNEVSPDIAVISCAKDNNYGHPNPEVLERLEGIRVFRTDQNGDIKFQCDIERCLVSTGY